MEFYLLVLLHELFKSIKNLFEFPSGSYENNNFVFEKEILFTIQSLKFKV